MAVGSINYVPRSVHINISGLAILAECDIRCLKRNVVVYNLQ